MSEESLFSNLKHSLEHAKDTILDVEHKRQIKLSMVVTDGKDDYIQRFSEMDYLASILKSEVLRVYLYELTSTLLKDVVLDGDELKIELSALEDEISEQERNLINALQEHSKKIKELKQENSQILLEDGFKSLLYKIRDLRQANKENAQLEKKDILALAGFFLDDYGEREDNLSTELQNLIKEKKPQLIYCKPPLLRNRDETPPLGKLEKSILRSKEDGAWVFFEGSTPLSKVENVVCLILGGDDEAVLLRNSQALLSIFSPDKVTITFLGLIPLNSLKMATLVAEENEAELRKKIELKLKDQFRRIRIQGKVPDIRIEFGDIENDLMVIIREFNPQLVFLSPKLTQEGSYDETTADISKFLLTEGISVFLTF